MEMQKIVRGVAVVALFVTLDVIVYLIDINFFRVDVVFYSSLFVACIAVVLTAALLVAIPWFGIFSTFEKLLLVCICILSGYSLAISVPTLIDRSLSFYVLEKLQQRGGGIALDKFNYIFTSEYMREHRLVDVRLTEQVESGTITIDNGCVRLTTKGDYLASFGQYFRKHLLPKQRLLRGEYTDQLTDPFARSDSAPDYLCD